MVQQSTMNKTTTQIVGNIFFLHGHANIVEQEEYLVWRLYSMSHWIYAHNFFLQEFTVLSGSPWASVYIQLALSRVPYQ